MKAKVERLDNGGVQVTLFVERATPFVKQFNLNYIESTRPDAESLIDATNACYLNERERERYFSNIEGYYHCYHDNRDSKIMVQKE